ncbi:4'-phosphopantetheinyl transferase [Gammaproteobacteria bacterium]
MPWQSPPTFPILATNQVHVWRASLKQDKKELVELLNLLSTQEKTRSSKFIAEHARNNFIVARGILRWLLAKYLLIKPQDPVFQQNQYGKLYLDSSTLQFNISHSHDFALFAFTLDHPIGVDIELIRNDFDFAPIAQRFFSKKEDTDLLAMPPAEQLYAFFNCWSRKEAFIKAIGKGIFFALDKFSVEVSNKQAGRLQLQITDPEYNANDWSLEALNPADGYVGAFAILCQKYEVCFYDFDNAQPLAASYLY